MELVWVYALTGAVVAISVLTWLVSVATSPAPIKLGGKHVLITGGSSGIGREIAICAAREGAHVSILARNAARLEKAKCAIQQAAKESSSSSTQRVEAMAADICEWEAVRDAIAKCVEASGPLDVLVCNAGGARPGVFETESVEALKYQMQWNWVGTLHTIKAALPYLKQGRDRHRACKGRGGGGGVDGGERELRSLKGEPGCIAIVSSQAGQVGVYGYSAYSSSKFALRGLAEVLQQELYCYNLRLCLIHPPDTATPGMIEEDKTKPELTRQISGTSDLCQPSQVAKDAVRGIKSGRFLVSTGFVGGILAMATAGMSPQPFCVSKIAEILFMGLSRVVALVVLNDWYGAIAKWHRKQKNETAN